MKITVPILVAIGLAPLAFAQSPSPAATAAAASSANARTDVYHVHFANAAPGKAQELAEDLKKQDPHAPNPGHYIVLRHE
ncbi:MAG: hypothetical protein ACJ8JD_02195, partial [Chthoniobacterales bacterium]